MSKHRWLAGLFVVALLIGVSAMFVRNGASAQTEKLDQAEKQDRYTLKIPDGLAFSEFRGYDAWQNVAPSVTEGSLKSILANPTMISAYHQGVPGNGKPFPDGSKIVKIEWVKKKNIVSPYFVEVPDTLKSLSFIVKDSKRFPNTNGWAYAKWDYDAASGTFKPDALSAKGHECGYTCHTIVKANDYIFTAYPKR